MIHKLKTHPEFFNQWISRNKSFEIRRDDRPFQPGDTIEQHEYDPVAKAFTGRVGVGPVVYVLRGFVGISKGYCAIECPFLKIKVRHSAADYEVES